MYYCALQRVQMQNIAVQCSAVQCSVVQCSAVQCSTVQCSVVQCSVLQAEGMVAGLSSRALLDYLHTDDIAGLKGFIHNVHVQVGEDDTITRQAKVNLQDLTFSTKKL